MSTETCGKEARKVTYEIISINRCRRGEVPMLKWDDKGKRYVIEIYKEVIVPHNS